MTDRHAGYVVTLDDNIREDDARNIIAAIRMVKGVLYVAPVVASPEVMIATARVKMEVAEKVMGVINEIVRG